jgi:hypothetical protein
MSGRFNTPERATGLLIAQVLRDEARRAEGYDVLFSGIFPRAP